MWARHTATPTTSAVNPKERTVRRVSRRETSDGAETSSGAAVIDTTPNGTTRVDEGRPPIRNRQRSVSAPLCLLLVAPGLAQPVEQRGLRRSLRPGCRAGLALRQDADSLLEVHRSTAGTRLPLGHGATVPLPDLEDALQRRVRDGEHPQLLASRLDDAPDAAVGAEHHLGGDGRPEHL